MSTSKVFLLVLIALSLAAVTLYWFGFKPGEDFFASGAINETLATSATSTKDVAAKEPEILYWVAPMDANYRRDKPGKSPMGMDLVPVYAKAMPESSAPAESNGAVIISPEVQHNLGIRTEAAEFRPIWRRIEATAYIGLDEHLISHVHMRTAGWIEQLLVTTEGERVKKGQLLFSFYSPELLNGQKELLQASRRAETALLAAAREKLMALGMVATEIDAIIATGVTEKAISVFSPSDGVVIQLNVREGMYIKPEDDVMSLADLSTVWMQAEVFESQVDWVKVGQSAEARLEYLPGEVFSGTVDYVYPVLDPRTRTLKVRLKFDNPAERLKPNMFAGVTIFGNTHLDALTIPRDALVRAADNNRVVVDEGDGKYFVHEVMTGLESGNNVEIIAGLQAGDRVVTSAQFLIDSEASLTGGVRRLESREREHSESQSMVFGSGTVVSLDSEKRSMMISHGPIDALGWPPMTMEFAVKPMVELQRIQPGQSVHFSIKADATGAYVIDMVHLVDPQASEEEQHGD